jgi:hypothetical protein
VINVINYREINKKFKIGFFNLGFAIICETITIISVAITIIAVTKPAKAAI